MITSTRSARGGSLELTIRSVIGTHFHKREPLSGHFGGYFSKTTYARRYDPLQGWVHLTLDDLRQAFWPPDRQVYWQVRRTDWDERARRLLHGVKVAALDAALAAGFSVVMADTHLIREVFEAELEVVEQYGLRVEWKVFDLSWEMLLARNDARGGIDPSHRQPETILRLAYDAFRSPDAWWRLLPSDQIELIEP